MLDSSLLEKAKEKEPIVKLTDVGFTQYGIPIVVLGIPEVFNEDEEEKWFDFELFPSVMYVLQKEELVPAWFSFHMSPLPTGVKKIDHYRNRNLRRDLKEEANHRGYVEVHYKRDEKDPNFIEPTRVKISDRGVRWIEAQLAKHEILKKVLETQAPVIETLRSWPSDKFFKYFYGG